MNLPPDYPTVIRRARKRAGLTQAQLAQRIGVSYQSVLRWEYGRTAPHPLAWREICRVFNLPFRVKVNLTRGENYAIRDH